jgi:hypothetical protein
MNRRMLLIIGGAVLLAVVALLFVSRVGAPDGYTLENVEVNAGQTLDLTHQLAP